MTHNYRVQSMYDVILLNYHFLRFRVYYISKRVIKYASSHAPTWSGYCRFSATLLRPYIRNKGNLTLYEKKSIRRVSYEHHAQLRHQISMLSLNYQSYTFTLCHQRDNEILPVTYIGKKISKTHTKFFCKG